MLVKSKVQTCTKDEISHVFLPLESYKYWTLCKRGSAVVVASTMKLFYGEKVNTCVKSLQGSIRMLSLVLQQHSLQA